MPSRLGARVGWSLGVCLVGALASGEAEARGLAPVPEPVEGPPAEVSAGAPEPVPVQSAEPTGPGFDELLAQAEAQRAAKAHAEAAELYGAAFRARPEAERGDAAGEAAVRNALVDYEIASTGGDELALRRAEAELLAEFLEARRKARAAAQIAHTVPVPEVPGDLVEVLAALEARIEELVELEEAERLAAEQREPVAVQSEITPAVVDRPPRRRPNHRLIYSNLTAVRYNPLGLVNEFTGGYRYQLAKKRSKLFNDSFLAVQLHTFLSPAYGRIGPKVDIQPLAILNLSATYDFTGYFGNFGLIPSFRSPTDDWSDTEIQRRDEAGDPSIDNYKTTGHFVTLAALLQAKVGRIAVRNNFKAYYTDYDLRAGDTVSYDQTLDIPLPNRGWTMTNELDALYVFDFGLTVGARYTVTQAFYQARHFQPAEPISQPNGPTHRVGPAVLYTFFDRPHQRFNKPTLILLTQWWAQHRFRTGADVSPALPYLVLAFRFEGDLLPDPATWNRKKEPKRKRRGRSR
jgi:hypothetical protein